MVSRPHQILFVGPSLIFLSCLLAGLIDSSSVVGSGIVMGTLLGHATLAAGWCALGPAPLIWRLPLSLLWIASLISAHAFSLRSEPLGIDQSYLAAISIGLSGQWLLVQALLWVLVIGFGLRLRQFGTAALCYQHHERQIGIRQLLTLTTIIAVALGIGRMALSSLSNVLDTDFLMHFIVILCGPAIIVTLPLLLAALSTRFYIPAVIATALLIAAATPWELLLLNRLYTVSGGGPGLSYLVLANLVMGLWVVAFVFAVRMKKHWDEKGVRSEWHGL
jgi:hypothetical protein